MATSEVLLIFRRLAAVRRVRRPPLHICALLVVVVVRVALLAYGASRHAPVMDEIAHIPSGISHWRFGRFDLYRVNPPLARMAAVVPLLFMDVETNWQRFHVGLGARPEFAIGQDFAVANKRRLTFIVAMARCSLIPFSVCGVLAAYEWSKRLYGKCSGVVAAALCAFCPNLIAYNQLVIPDGVATSIGIVANFLFWNWLKQPRIVGALFAGCGLGVACLAKSTWLVLFALWPLIAVGLLRSEFIRSRFMALRLAGQLGIALLAGLYLINACYGFQGTCANSTDFRPVSAKLTALVNRIERCRWLPPVRVPLPQDYAIGLDLQIHEFECKKWSYLRGQWKLGGWCYYYLYALAVKVPIGFTLLALVAIVSRVLDRRYRLTAIDECAVLAPLALILLVVSSQTGFSRYIRYALPILPLGYIWISGVGRAFEYCHRRSSIVVLTLLVLGITSSLAAYPHTLAYFNEFAGGPRNGHLHLLDANIDWGQDLTRLADWYNAHPKARPLRCAYFGAVDPRLYGVQYVLPPRAAPSAPQHEPHETGWYAISVNLLRGYPCYVHDGRGGLEYQSQPWFTYLLRFRPVKIIGYSIFIYHLSDDAPAQVIPRTVEKSATQDFGASSVAIERAGEQ